MERPQTLPLALAVVNALAAGNAGAQPPCVNINIAGLYSGSTFDPGVDDLGIHCDDCTVPVTFPFPVRMYGVDYASAVVSSNGNVQFAGASTQYQDESLPTRNMDTAVFPLWDDLILTDPGDGVFTSTTGSAPGRVFNIEWRAHYFNAPSSPAHFEVRFFENSRSFEFVYGDYATYPLQTYVIGVQMGLGEQARNAGHGSSAYPAGTRIAFTETYTTSHGPFTGAFPHGVTDIGNHCDDCITPIALPFPVDFYGQTYASANVSSNGNLQFGSANAEYINDCPPVAAFGPTIFAHWDDLRTDAQGDGVFTNLSGVAPFRIFDIEWRAHYFAGGGFLVFTLRFLEGLNSFELFFLNADQHGASATLGTQAGDERYGDAGCNFLNNAFTGDVYIFSLPPMNPTGYGGYVPPCTTDIGNHCDDCTTTITLPFIVSLFGEGYTTANVSSNGNIQFGSNLNTFTNTCLPNPAFGTTIFGYWDDLLTNSAPGSGIYTSIFGTAPNRQFGIEWRATSISTGAEAHFEVVLSEITPRFSIYYGNLPGGGGGGASATAGVQHGNGPEVLQHFCNAIGRTPVSIDYLCLGPSCQPTVTASPADAMTCPSGAAAFSVTAADGFGGGPSTYQWQVQTAPTTWQNLGSSPAPLPCGGGAVAFASPLNSPAVAIGIRPCPNPVPGAPQHFQVRCIVSNACGSAASDEATYTICPADANCSGAVTIQDLFDFLSAWFARAPAADINGSGSVTVQDLFDFLAAWFAPC